MDATRMRWLTGVCLLEEIVAQPTTKDELVAERRQPRVMMINFAIHDLKVRWRKRVIDQSDWKEENRAVGCDFYTLVRFRFRALHTYCTACTLCVLVATGLV